MRAAFIGALLHALHNVQLTGLLVSLWEARERHSRRDSLSLSQRPLYCALFSRISRREAGALYSSLTFPTEFISAAGLVRVDLMHVSFM